MQSFIIILIAALVALIAYAAFRSFRLVTVWDYEKGLKYSNGRFVGLLEPGVYPILKPFADIVKVDARAQDVVIPGQEVLTSDAVAIKVGITGKFRIADPKKAIQESSGYFQALYIALQTALREIIGRQTADELLENRSAFDDKLMELSKPQVEDIGVELLAVKIRDVTFPGDLKKAFAQVVTARKEGQAALERARGETAALRSLANAARMLDNNPSLMQLRTIQAVAESPGSTVVLGLPEGAKVVRKTIGTDTESEDKS